MKVNRLRLIQGCHALAHHDVVIAGPTTTIDMIGGGNFLVKTGDKIVFVPNHQVHFAVCEEDTKKAGK